MKLHYKWILFILPFFIMVAGCSSSAKKPIQKGQGTRDNTPVDLEPQPSGKKTLGNEKIIFDVSHCDQGYVMVKYLGNNPKVKVRITNPNGDDPYTYTVFDGYNVFPLTGGNGEYLFQAFENVSGSKYSQLFQGTQNIEILNDYVPYLYPNQYVNYNQNTKTIKKGQEIAEGADTDLDVVTYVYDYVVHNITYDYEKADLAKNGHLANYLPDVDHILQTQKGICFDYAAVMATMLRTQNIPTRMMIGYITLDGNSIYHAWIGVYIHNVGWVDDFIQFDGKNWSMMDPTLISDGHNQSKIKDFIKNQDNYITKYLY